MTNLKIGLIVSKKIPPNLGSEAEQLEVTICDLKIFQFNYLWVLNLFFSDNSNELVTRLRDYPNVQKRP